MPVQDPITKKLITGPLILKTDAGPGRLSKEAESIEFCEKSAAEGEHILLSLPNGTECTAELDQIYSTFKPATKKSTKRVAAKKMVARVEARKKADERENETSQSFVQDLEVFLNGEEGNPDDIDDDLEGAIDLKVGSSVCSVVLTYKDLSSIVNGCPGDPIGLRPFDLCFSQEKTLNTWRAVGFLPMNRNAVNDPKVRYELGEGGAPEEDLGRMELLVEEYKRLGRCLLGWGSRVVFSISNLG